MMQRVILVAGVSSSGKSTFICDDLLPSLQSLDTENSVEVFFGGKLVREFDLKNPAIAQTGFHLGNAQVAIVHYNLLMTLEADQTLETFELQAESLIQALKSYAPIDHLYLCYAPDAVIRSRMQTRCNIEPTLSPQARAYPKQRFLSHFDKVNQRQLLIDLVGVFQGKSRQTSVVFSGSNSRTLLSWSDFLSGHPTAALEAAITPDAGHPVV